jgi:tRNA(Ile)-lysidine synthase
MRAREVRDAVRAGGLLAGPGPIVTLISAGRDSTCLLDVAVALRGTEAVRALHVNYGLREQADADERRCRELCAALGVDLDVVAAGPVPQAGGNVQAWARDVRYAAGRHVAEELGGRVATGHTASDQVETILYRLAASPGRRALLGMPAAEGLVVRPLLGLTREQTATYCRERALDWVEDESNADQRYARARVRHGVVPALRAVHAAAEANVLRTAALLREETELLERLVTEELSGGQSVTIERLAAMAPALARLVVIRLAESATGAFVPQAGDRVGELIELGRRSRHAELHVGGGAGAVIEDGVLRMVALAPREPRSPEGAG